MQQTTGEVGWPWGFGVVESFLLSFFFHSKHFLIGIFAILEGGGRTWTNNHFRVRDFETDGSKITGIEVDIFFFFFFFFFFFNFWKLFFPKQQFSSCVSSETILQSSDFIVENCVLRSTQQTVGIRSTQTCATVGESWDNVTLSLNDVSTQQEYATGW